jgi:hypothetical protein
MGVKKIGTVPTGTVPTAAAPGTPSNDQQQFERWHHYRDQPGNSSDVEGGAETYSPASSPSYGQQQPGRRFLQKYAMRNQPTRPRIW